MRLGQEIQTLLRVAPRRSRISRSAGPLPHIPRSANATGPSTTALTLIANDVLAELALRPQVHQSVLRLRVHLESFVRDEVLAAMRDSAAANHRNERVLQKAMDRFLFGEGLFPLTHFELANGSVDTAFEVRRSAAAEQASLLQTPPALIELKQAVTLDATGPSASAVRTAVTEATQQAARYRASLGAMWPSHVVYAAVVYDGPTAYLLSPPHERVVLVYLGDATPSGSKRNLDLVVGDF